MLCICYLPIINLQRVHRELWETTGTKCSLDVYNSYSNMELMVNMNALCPIEGRFVYMRDIDKLLLTEISNKKH